MKTCDLHTHSIYSDGTYTPKELIEAGEAAGLSAIALCDHNTIAGLDEFLSAAEGKSIIAVPGIEFSSEYNGTELHILGLFIKREHFSDIAEMMKIQDKHKEESNLNLVKALNKAGYKIDYDVIKSKTPEGHINRAHIASELTEKGYTSSVEEAFNTLVSKKMGFYIPPPRYKSIDIIRFIKSIGAVAILAHPFLDLDENKLDEFLTEAKEAGLDGMETNYSKFDKETTEKAIKTAKNYGILQSGGSDFHGERKPEIALGTGYGDLSVPFDYFLKLQQAL